MEEPRKGVMGVKMREFLLNVDWKKEGQSLRRLSYRGQATGPPLLCRGQGKREECEKGDETGRQTLPLLLRKK